MNITIEIPDEMNVQLAGIKNINVFVHNTLKTAHLKNRFGGTSP
ncbi:MAG: hypothetical protein PHH59_00920 [Methylovulum sp.]|nr:hypothetical protein [Methylovulum sp.]MDD2722569.1 hypothetical protein [Methylovulum sp.]MDD5123097.1 hypothetical protein [Methylovulum sp.]